MACGIENGKQLTDKENQEHQHQELEEHDETRRQAEALALKLAQTYEELTRLLERNPGVKRQITEGTAKEDKVYQKLKQRLKLADMAPRCRWVRQDGTSCGSPQMKQHIYCFAHMQMEEARELMLRLPPPEDANAIQIGLMRIQKSLIEDTISTKKAGLLLYSMQLALTNVGQTTFGQAKDEEMVRETMDEEEAFSENRKPLTTKDTEEEKGLPRMDADKHGLQPGVSRKQNLFTAKGAEDAKENQGLPLMNTDGTDFGEAGGKDGGEEVEFVPVPGGYGFERIRLRIEPSGHRANASAGHLTPSSATMARCGNPDNREIGTPPRSAPHADAEVHAVLG